MMKIVWDEAKRLANIDKHGLDFADLDVAFFLDGIIVRARNPRFKAFNTLRDMIACAIFAPLGSEAIAVISLRPASATEREGLT